MKSFILYYMTFQNRLFNAGYYVSVSGVALLLLWIGAFKFTPTEAEAIKPLVSNSPLMGWLYKWFSVQTVSSIIGSIEILIALLLVLSFFGKQFSRLAGVLSAITFLITLTFLFSTPGAVSKVDGIWVPDAFLLKDLVSFGVSLMVMANTHRN